VRTNLGEHLRTRHLIHSKNTAGLAEYIGSLDIADRADQVSRPTDGVAPIPGLPAYNGYRCTTTSKAECRYITTYKRTRRDYLQKAHQIRAVAKGRRRRDISEDVGFHPVQVQTLFTEKRYIDYFVVSVPEENNTDNKAGQLPCNNNHQRQGEEGVQTVQGGLIPSGTAANELQQSYQEAQDGYAERYNVVSQIEHVSELTRWLRTTGYQDHIEGIKVDELPASYQLPTEEEEPVLSVICSSITRILREAIEVVAFDKSEVRRLSRLNSRLLNTLVPNTIARKLFRPLQNRSTREKYIQTF
jgi:hypothetical protein